jgi:4-hydroxy-4-methyl-2-oxoglutarate aldolase
MIDEPPLLTIRRRPPPPAADLLQPFREAPTGWLVDAMGGRGALDVGIKPLAPGRFVGTALTCWCGPNDNLALMAAVSLAEAGDVVVAATEGFAGSGMAGDLLVGMARNRGVVGLVADGMVRDRNAIVALGLPVFCRGVIANSCVRSGPGTVGLPLVVGGVAVASGDLLVGDADGVVVVPREQLTQVGRRLADVARAEREAEAAVQAGQTELPAIATLLASDRVRWID